MLSRLLHVFVFDLLAVVTIGANYCHAAEDQTMSLPENVSFNAHIRPIMSKTCFVCHGPDEENNPSELRLDSFESATGELPSAEEEVAIQPGRPKESVVYQRITETDSDEQMPPSDYRHQLSNRDKALFRRWIEQGAKYELHWSYAPLRRPAVPKLQVHSENTQNAIDAFIFARLEMAEIEPSPPAEKAVLLRRLSLDLIGLPPTPTELAEFLADESPDAYERQVDRLLALPQYGERMAAPWLDIVRFADTVGFHGDQNQHIFPYRDYVIQAFNDNKPFDQFTLEQLAGDLLPNPTTEQLTATGLVRLNMMTREGGAQPKEFLAKYAADRVRMIGTAWLGSTLACCECHDHKFDPFATKDFYSLGAFFDDVRQWGVYTTYVYTPNPELSGFTNDHPFPPELRLMSPSLLNRIRWLQQQADARIAEELPDALAESDEFQSWVDQVQKFVASNPTGWITGAIIKTEADQGTTTQPLPDGSLLFSDALQSEKILAVKVSADESSTDEILTVEVQFPTTFVAQALRVEVLPDKRHEGFVGRGQEGRFSLELKVFLKTANQEDIQPLKIAWSQADRRVPLKYVGGSSSPYLGPVWQSGPARWQLPRNEAKLTHTAVFHLETPIQLSSQESLVVQLKSNDVGRIRLASTPWSEAIPGQPAVSERLALTLRRKRANWETSDHAAVLAAYYRATTPPDKVNEICRTFRKAIVECRAGYAYTLITQSVPIDKIPIKRVLPRGNWQDESGEIVLPNVPQFLPQPESTEGRRLTRVDLANWLTSDDNPLTARHFVNRLWKQFFGAGLSNILDDLGNQGEWPSHPQLLDWLASEFRGQGWNVKRIVRLIVMSHAYRQRAACRPELAKIDPYNRLLAQQSARRLDAEFVRDNALAISGLLSKNLIGGPSVHPYQPVGYWTNLQFPSREYVSDVDDRQYRRGVYMHWQRTFLHPMLASFDAPGRDECAADRTFSNSPQQALTLLNDPTFVEASRALADRILTSSKSTDFAAVLDSAFLRAVSRPAHDQERESLKRLYEEQLAYYKKNPEEVKALQEVGAYHMKTGDVSLPELAAWTQVCRVILNLHETFTRF